jgi:hypothetical protein
VPRLLQELSSAKRSAETGPVDFVRNDTDVSSISPTICPRRRPADDRVHLDHEAAVHGGKTVLASTSDVDEYVEALRAVLTAAVQKGSGSLADGYGVVEGACGGCAC